MALVCEVPEECQLGGDGCAGVGAACGDYCAADCNPCSAPVDYTPCPPGGDCNYRCDCGDFNGCCYQQPSRTLPIRPETHILTSCAPLETDTIYKRSYYANCGDCFRAKPITPCNTLQITSQAPIEKCTVQKLSYMPPCNAGRTPCIRPKENCLRFCGPLYAMTSQKHDFVPKGYARRPPIYPADGICKPCDPLERCTINKLSYLPNDVCKNPPPKSMIQGYHYLRPNVPIDNCTIQKLSYRPVCLPSREPTPWADNIRCEPPRYQNLCTTYNLSYMPNCNPGRTAATMPLSCIKLGTDSGDGNTVYKLSYMPVDARCCRPAPIVPINGVVLPPGGPMEKCTVQKLSYQPNCCVGRTMPIRPKENCVKPMGPLYAMTTQKHDFGPKPMCRRPAIVPATSICRPTGGIDKCTINKLSYMPVNVCENPRPNAVMPRLGICRPTAPMEKCTTYKLSYLPNCPQPRKQVPWAAMSSYCKPTTPIEKCTIQRLSYGPPGNFSRCGACCTGNGGATAYPKAGIC